MPKYIFPSEAISHFPAKLNIFALKPVRLNNRSILDLASRLNFSSNRSDGILQQHPTKFVYSNGSWELTVYKGSGGWHFRNKRTWQVDDGKSKVEFTQKAAEETALNHIKKLEIVDPREYQLLKVSPLHVGVVDRTTGYAEERVIDMGVAFQRVVDGVPVYGPGGKMVIYLNHAGELTGFDCIWRQVQNLHSPVERLQPLENAFNDLVKRWGRVGNGSIAVKEVRIEYFELGWEHTQRYLQPAFIMPLTIVSNRGRVMMRSEHVFPAAANCVGILMPRLPRQFNRKSAQQTPARTPK